MSRSKWSPANRRYQRRFWPAMIAYVALVVLISWVTPIENLPDGPKHAAALLPVIPIGVVIWAMARLLEEQEDEYFRLLQARSMLLATGVILLGATAWGFLQEYTDLPPFPVIILFPCWCAAWSLTSAWVAWRAR
ncbi:hypothetical protein [Phenylobacterium deserti]|uniref:Uncharacterized protein n=1 Tax=Phenylobacterium deserti TaxID=1914756 RepID=A0A328APA6_9CAUL|nr:hypothetical protein [Phenylobacterium deserti]RAK56832.1 hypothetical protein DJ018_02340 [Phenylobacterium deserti]